MKPKKKLLIKKPATAERFVAKLSIAAGSIEVDGKVVGRFSELQFEVPAPKKARKRR